MPLLDGTSPLFSIAMILAKATTLLGLAALASLLLARSSAAARHGVWTLAVAALLALPAAQILLPELRAPGFTLGGGAEPRRPHAPAPSDLGIARPEEIRNGDRTIVSAAEDPRPDGAVPPSPLPWSWLTFAAIAWAVGAGLTLFRFVLDARALRRMAQGASAPAGPEWTLLVSEVARRLRVRRPVRLLLGPPGTAPMTWGTVRPVVLLPETAASWSPEDRTMVLTHEMGHVKRLDCLIQSTAHVACALYWFHPAVWLAAFRLRVERERACDDLVLESGASATRYAGQLVQVVRASRWTKSLLASPAPSIANPTRLEERIRSVLDLRVDRRAPSRGFRLGMVALTAILALPLAALAPAQDSPGEPVSGDRDAAEPLEKRWEQTLATGKRPFWIAIAIPYQAYEAREVLFSDSEDDHFDEIGRGGRTLAERHGFHESDAVILFRVSKKPRSSDAPFDRIAIRSAKLSHDNGGLDVVSLGRADVRQSFDLVLDLVEALPDDARARVAVTALSLHGVPETEPALRKILDGRRSGTIRTQAAEGLARHPGESALKSLTSHARKDASMEVRREAAEAVGDLKYEPATDALIDLVRTLDDEDVRAEAVESLGARPADRVVPVLVSLSESDPSEKVQCEAVETLGDLPARAGLKALRKIVRDHPNGRVRDEAFETLNEMVERAEREEGLEEGGPEEGGRLN